MARKKSPLINLAKELRTEQTDVEKILWHHLRNRRLENCKFRRQYIIDRYITDFICLEKKLIIELDGGQHMENANADADAKRSLFLESKGFTVLRFWNNDILQRLDGVLETIAEYL